MPTGNAHPVCGRHGYRGKFDVASHEIELFGRHAPAIFQQIIGSEYPKFAGFEADEAGFRCRFYNGPSDNNPSSFCAGNRSRILLQGSHDLGAGGISICTTPNQIFDWVVSQHRVDGDAPADDWIMRRYRATVDDRGSLARFIDDNIVEMIAPPATTVTPAWILKLFGSIGTPMLMY